MNDLTPFDNRLDGLLAALSPARRRQMAAEIARRLRASQQTRIKRQQAPDGTAYAARKRQPLRAKRGRIRRAMFSKLRTNRYMQAKGSSEAATVAFVGRVQRIARVHQYGLRDRPNRYAREVPYPARPLLGFSDADRRLVEDIIINHLGA